MKLATDTALHPSRDKLERFMRSELPRAQAMAVVRHLLRGCPRCSLVVCRLWGLGAEPHLVPETRGQAEERRAGRDLLRGRRQL